MLTEHFSYHRVPIAFRAVDAMYKLQAKWPAEFEATSRRRFRDGGGFAARAIDCKGIEQCEDRHSQHADGL